MKKRSPRKEASDAEKDASFIAAVRAALPEGLDRLLRSVSHKSCPEWKRVCVRRAIARVRAVDPSWVRWGDPSELRKAVARRTDPAERSALEEAVRRVAASGRKGPDGGEEEGSGDPEVLPGGEG